MKPDYKDRNPGGWGGDPARGAALGRRDLPGDPDYTGKVTLRRVRLDSGGYDPLGTYWGHGAPLYWAAADIPGDPDGDACWELVIRAGHREEAKAIVRQTYPNCRFYR